MEKVKYACSEYFLQILYSILWSSTLWKLRQVYFIAFY